MSKITFCEFEKIMTQDLLSKADPCVEINFLVEGCLTYHDSWVGKMIDLTTNKDVYWLGLTYDGLHAYDFDSFDSLINEKAFYGGKSLYDLWQSISILSVCGGTAEEVL